MAFFGQGINDRNQGMLTESVFKVRSVSKISESVTDQTIVVNNMSIFGKILKREIRECVHILIL